ncbi:MAG: hypothetical protein A3G49_04635 [Candidatus Sungbacteria bacterium RIFCSPLOWO2_12_FULL_41_11]|uniref:Uncharacterized protein n=1 Tax=Candidatus Sungbacteria bacterium RIFCSPLOWO2_12_FULL_41_11 TaxID=1802286 RepID=A0A1G2LNB9_9BACT|nr:MAG: hypothetical protein UV01_C0002G0073 [Parcubacteria group bacterium GW2011_GWA2_42_14]OGZ99565.1 MAG: hypothetical protein A3D41_01085 [Candidatus Sungbacteria bacterium RIFCSPHIGHO2_02_FULL_41_12b]OHA13118.1 MAG: hypothetical protein A3G49_04635 [Candidatus Sungbacteria bacterium RIFCSPLOWO2_12_FULL_41_11]
MAYVERTDEEIIAAWARWLERHPKPDEICLMPDGLTPRQVVAAIKKLVHPYKSMMVDNLREIARVEDCDPRELIVQQEEPKELDGSNDEGGESG